ncbi:MAG: response regulator [Candidatus Abyssobacteria bacterium SURF_5]|uniref:Response regulator n=1 Tax=Abyssobacteria bacterium (strain SURF_5) TaxID=2093360 RepID=A0A3A4NL83_ABYX5|nr:MAG: response regulator [Candidatus Abyssubacteria bacterium SURF_5]
MQGKLNVLLIDDEPIVGKRLQPALSKVGCDVEIFTDPLAAVARLNEKTFDIVVADIRMEQLDGIEILERVIAKSPRTKVIMITGYATLEMAREAQAKGAFDFIAKPFTPGDLREVIAKAADSLGIKGIREEAQPRGTQP